MEEQKTLEELMSIARQHGDEMAEIIRGWKDAGDRKLTKQDLEAAISAIDKLAHALDEMRKLKSR